MKMGYDKKELMEAFEGDDLALKCLAIKKL